MRIILSNDKQFIIKIKYHVNPMSKYSKDEYGREVITCWNDYTTEVTIREWTEKEYQSKVIVKGYSHCSYKDKFSKSIGRSLAYYDAVTTMLENGLISVKESEEFDMFDLNATVFDVTLDGKKNHKIDECVRQVLLKEKYSPCQTNTDGTLKVQPYHRSHRV